MPTIPFHQPGVTYNDLHSTTSPTAAQVAADLATTKQHFEHARTYYPQYGGGVVDVGKVAKEADLNLLLGLFLFEGHDDWTENNYQSFVKSAGKRGNIAGILVGNEDPQMMDLIVKYLEQAKRDCPQISAGTSQKSDFWLSDLQRVTGWAQTEQVVLYIHNMFDDQYGVDTSSPFNYHFGLIDDAGKSKGILF